MILNGIDCHLYSVCLVFQIRELAISNIVRGQQVLCCGDSKVFLEYTEVHLVGAIQLFKPDSVNNLRVEVIDMILVGNNHRLLPKLLENGLRISIRLLVIEASINLYTTSQAFVRKITGTSNDRARVFTSLVNISAIVKDIQLGMTRFVGLSDFQGSGLYLVIE